MMRWTPAVSVLVVYVAIPLCGPAPTTVTGDEPWSAAPPSLNWTVPVGLALPVVVIVAVSVTEVPAAAGLLDEVRRVLVIPDDACAVSGPVPMLSASAPRMPMAATMRRWTRMRRSAISDTRRRSTLLELWACQDTTGHDLFSPPRRRGVTFRTGDSQSQRISA